MGDAMKTTMTLSRHTIALWAIRDMAIDGILGAVTGALFGLVFGGFGALVHGESWRLVSIAGYSALYGAVAGTLIAACSAILNGGATTSDSTNDSPRPGAEKESSVAAVRDRTVPSQRSSQTILPTASTPDRRRTLTGVSNQPLSC
jgi:hypothetical protein